MEGHRNIKKERAVWKRLGNLLQWEGADIQVSALFYRVVIQEVLMLGSDLWEMSYARIKAVEGTHMGFLRLITGKCKRYQADRAWETPDAEKVLQAAGTH